MLDVKVQAELKKINLRAEAHGEEWVRAVDIWLMLIDAPADKITSFVPNLAERFYADDGEPVLREVLPLVVNHKLENVAAKISRTSLVGDIKSKAKIWPKPGGVADIEVKLQVSDFADGLLDTLSHHLRDTMTVSLSERQASLIDDMEQGEAA